MFKFFQSFYFVSTLFPSVRFDSLEFCLLTITNTQFYFGCTSKTIAKVVVCPYCHYCLCYLCHLIANAAAVVVPSCFRICKQNWAFPLNYTLFPFIVVRILVCSLTFFCTGFRIWYAIYFMRTAQFASVFFFSTRWAITIEHSTRCKCLHSDRISRFAVILCCCNDAAPTKFMHMNHASGSAL